MFRTYKCYGVILVPAHISTVNLGGKRMCLDGTKINAQMDYGIIYGEEINKVDEAFWGTVPLAHFNYQILDKIICC